MTLQLACIPPQHAAQVWPLAAPFIRSAMKRGGGGSFQGIEASVLSGQCLLWLADDGTDTHAAAVTQVQVSEWRRVCEVLACGGRDMSRWLGMLGMIEDYARSEECEATRVVGRLGWQRALPDYKATQIVLEKALT